MESAPVRALLSSRIASLEFSFYAAGKPRIDCSTNLSLKHRFLQLGPVGWVRVNFSRG
jgi:hypothetical protein